MKKFLALFLVLVFGAVVMAQPDLWEGKEGSGLFFGDISNDTMYGALHTIKREKASYLSFWSNETEKPHNPCLVIGIHEDGTSFINVKDPESGKTHTLNLLELAKQK